MVANFEDLKVLGKGDFKSLMKWRLAIRLDIGLDVKADAAAEATEEVNVEPMDEDEQISEEVGSGTFACAVLTLADIPSSSGCTSPSPRRKRGRRSGRMRRNSGTSSSCVST